MCLPHHPVPEGGWAGPQARMQASQAFMARTGAA